jgi:toxin YoeB
LKTEPPRLAVFQPGFIEDLHYSVATDRRTAKRLLELVQAVLREPFSGIGKPEPLISGRGCLVAPHHRGAPLRLPGQA